MYKFLRENGIGASLLMHWGLYYFALFNDFMDWGFNGKISYSIQWGSLPFLGLGVGYTFYKCMDDCNVKYLLACLFTFALRIVIIAFKPWKFDSSAILMIVCGFSMLGFFIWEKQHKKSNTRYFKH